MGVCQCDVDYCEEIMCDDYIEEYGYLCRKHKEALIILGPKTNLQEFFNGQLTTENLLASKAYFEKIIKSRL